MKVVKSDKLSSQWEDRFVIIDETTGEILDDAQGYGYTSAQNAHRAWAYKTKKKTKKRVDAKNRFWKKNPEFEDRVAVVMFDVYKDEQCGIKHTKDEIFNVCNSIAEEIGVNGFRREYL